ncbi:MAG: transcriptional regulator GcvA [Halofilum sp. (in: g-proteobacteria)]|nr:transcriptional regulator GcvA [Halofilum sp. (in: g-proteobacteria)]
MKRLPPLNTLRAFEAAARHESFLQAAEELHLTPSAVSHQIRTLEEHLGVSLFHRRPRAVSLNDAGRAFSASVREALQDIARAAERAASDPGARVLTVSAAPVFAMGWLVPRLAGFHARRPDIEVRLDTSLDMLDLETSDVDMAVRYTARPDFPGLRVELLLHEQPAIVCSHEMAAKLSGPEDLRNTPLIHTRTQVGKWRAVLAASGIEGVDLDRGLHFANDMLALEAAASGLGVAIVNQNVLAERWFADGRLTIPFALDYTGPHGYYLCYPEDAADRDKIVAFRDWLREVVEQEGPASG